jgi:hypothetical protein
VCADSLVDTVSASAVISIAKCRLAMDALSV